MVRHTLVLATLLSTSLAVAPAAGEGINFSWNECGSLGIPIATFACDANTGVHSAIASFVPPSGIDRFTGLEAEIDIASLNDLPQWWLHGTDLCRGGGGLAVGVDFTAGSSGCADPWEGQATSGRFYEVGYGGPNHARVRVIAALPFERALDSATEYYGFNVRVMHSKSTGTGNCAGCVEPIRLTLGSIKLMQPTEVGNDPVLTTPLANAVIHWQNTFGPLPTLDAVTPTVGASGTPVTLTGSGFSAITSVRFHTLEAAFTTISDSEISTTVPAGARTGSVHVQGSNGIGSSPDLFIVAPEITSFTPTRAPEGNTVVISGVNFTRATAVDFNGVPGTFSVDADTRILAVVPAGATDGPITVTNDAGSDVSDDVFYPGPLPLAGSGLNLSWDDCGTAGTSIKSFACNTNSGSAFQLYGSFGAPENIHTLISATSVLEVVSSSSDLPDWWKFGNGQCRPTSQSVSFDFSAGPFSCLDPWQGQATGGSVYDVGYGGADRARLRIFTAVPTDPAAALTPGGQYYAFRVNIVRTRTTGTVSCSGCDVPMCINYRELQLFQESDEGYDPVITHEAERNFVHWQAAVTCPSSAPPIAGVPVPSETRLALGRVATEPDGRSVTFSVTLASAAPALIELYDSGGRRLMNGRLDGHGAGPHQVRVAAERTLPSGMYFARIVQGSQSATRRLVFTR